MLALLIYLILAGAALYIVNLLPIDATLKRIIWVIVIVAICIYAIYFLAAFLPDIQRIR